MSGVMIVAKMGRGPGGQGTLGLVGGTSKVDFLFVRGRCEHACPPAGRFFSSAQPAQARTSIQSGTHVERLSYVRPPSWSFVVVVGGGYTRRPGHPFAELGMGQALSLVCPVVTFQIRVARFFGRFPPAGNIIGLPCGGGPAIWVQDY